ncbi:Ppx/GppA family phosphatase [Sphingobium sufflavum]|uniref:Ppx/GppA phosphatase family protein n=1 Tax=Sphingobium sufflavum TaxID=1129547 RepID=UPI001F349071|nr:Ppx/GppA phosphatase family protein [Sphingobium sufflavum]MCE7797686.1 Ppx/GppA family phosphatase [Sphingobium sufflavum]
MVRKVSTHRSRAPASAAPDRAVVPPRGDPRAGATAISLLRPDRHSGPPRSNFAAIDLGTNNCRLLIARPAEDGFVVVDAFSRIVRLGEGLEATGRLSEAAIDRAISALSVCAGKLRRRRVTLARSVATEACRRADNGDDFVRRVYDETGIKLDIISAREEARLAVLGSHSLLETGDGPAMIFDIGGGSTELVLLDTSSDAPRILDWHSAPWGVVSLSESITGTGSPDPATRETAYRAMRERVAEALSSFVTRLPGGTTLRMLGTSGTVTTLASVHLDLPRYDRSSIDGLMMPTETLRGIATRLAGMSIDDRAALPCIGPERADLVVAGCAILEGILDVWPADRLSVADRGIREGILRSLMHGNASLPQSAPPPSALAQAAQVRA